MNTEKLINDIRNTGDYIPDEYDGSYELMRSIIEKYAELNAFNGVTYLDLNAVYAMAIGTWKMSVEKKKEYVAKTCLPGDSKQSLFDTLDRVWDKACRKEYIHSTDNEIGLASKGKPIVGMFGTGFYSFSKTSVEEAVRFIRMCTQILNMDNDNAIFNIAEEALSKGIMGMAAGSGSVILHCLKPYTFPVINGNFIGETIYPILGVQLSKMNSLKHFIKNCRAIKQFRDENFGRINYRVFDYFSLRLDAYIDNKISIEKLKTAVEIYKQNFDRVKKEETYKWQAIKYFQDHFDINSSDFSRMFEEATRKEINLLTGANYYAKRTILMLADQHPEEVRDLFRNLYDESVSVLSRIRQFEDGADELYYRDHSDDRNSYQSDRAATTYLFLMYPQRYYMYMPSKFNAAAEYLEFGELASGGTMQKVSQYFEMADQVWEYVKTDQQLIDLSHSRLGEDCYPDENNHVLAEDVIWFIYREYSQGKLPPEPVKPDEQENSDYWPSQKEYPLNLTKENWLQFLNDIELPDHPQTIKMLKGMMDLGGEASPKQLSATYGGIPSTYVGCTTNLGRRAMKYFDLSPCLDGDAERVFPIPFQGHHTEWNGKMYYSYRIRPELLAALKETDLSAFDPYTIVEVQNDDRRYWLYAPGEKAVMWNECVKDGVMVIGWQEMGDLSEYDSREDIISRMKEVYGNTSQYWMNSAATWQFSHVIKPGDVIYAKKGRSKLVGRGTVTSEYYYEQERGDYPNVLNVNWTDVGEWDHPGLAQVKTLTEINKYSDYAEMLNKIFENTKAGPEVYTKENFLNDVYISESDYEELKALLDIKNNIILQGAPGVGKTYTAKRLAYAIMGVKDESRIQFIQFHQNYSYEDFIMGYKPDENGSFTMKEGVFYDFCKKAENDTKHTYFFIIDEINRGNLSKIFGELLMAIEADYRGQPVRLAYRDEDFTVPDNVRIIGMMNTADRSLALIDYALRRRFSFVSMKPGFETEGFMKYQTALHNDQFDALVAEVIKLNQVILNDESLGEGFRIGHSYFCNLDSDTCTPERLSQIVKYDLIPTLEEYWFDNKDLFSTWKKNLEDAVK